MPLRNPLTDEPMTELAALNAVHAALSQITHNLAHGTSDAPLDPAGTHRSWETARGLVVQLATAQARREQTQSPNQLRELAEAARARSAELDIQAGTARIAGDADASDALASRSSFAWGVSQAMAWLAGEETGPMLAEVLGLR